MTTLGQVLANRENALLSTGPKTEEGKARAAQNSRTHGLCALVVVAKGEDAVRYAAFAEGYVKELDPQTVAQLELAERIVGMVWKARRAETVETELWNSGGGTVADMAVMLETHGPQLDRVMRYARQNTRELAAARVEYRQMQAEQRRLQEEVAKRAAAETAEVLKQKRIKEEDAWAETRSHMEAELAEMSACDAAEKEGKSREVADAVGAKAWQVKYTEEILKSRKQLGRPVGQLMAESYYIEEEGQAPSADKNGAGAKQK